jgi:hypothetical protein
MTTTPAPVDPAVQSAARWFWWIAGLSLVNTVLFYSGSDINFVLGLGMTTLANLLFADQVPMAVAISALTIGFYGLVGGQAVQGRLWAFYVGVVVYAADALIYMQVGDWMSVAFHAVAIFYIARGIMRARELGRAALAAPASPQA